MLCLCANSQHRVDSLQGRSHHWGGVIAHALAAALVAAFTLAPTLFLLERTEATAATYKACRNRRCLLCGTHSSLPHTYGGLCSATGSALRVWYDGPSGKGNAVGCFFLVSSPHFYYKLTVCIAMVYSVISSTFYCDQQLLELLALLADLLVGGLRAWASSCSQSYLFASFVAFYFVSRIHTCINDVLIFFFPPHKICFHFCQTVKLCHMTIYLVENLSHHSYNLIYCLQSVKSCQCLTVELLRRTRKTIGTALKGACWAVKMYAFAVRVSFLSSLLMSGAICITINAEGIIFISFFYVFQSVSAELQLLC